MLKFSVDFDGDEFRRNIVAQLKEGHRKALASVGLTNRVKITYTGVDSHGVPAGLKLSGSKEDVAKASKALGIKKS